MNNYSKEFKTQALQLSDKIRARKTSEDLGISYGTVTDWRKSKNRYTVIHKEEKKNNKAVNILESEQNSWKSKQELKETALILQSI